VSGWWVSMDDGRDTVWWGPFDDAALCQRFCAFVTREIDPAVMLGPPTEPRSDRVVLNPLHELLAFYEQQTREDRLPGPGPWSAPASEPTATRTRQMTPGGKTDTWEADLPDGHLTVTDEYQAVIHDEPVVVAYVCTRRTARLDGELLLEPARAQHLADQAGIPLPQAGS
jgi:hypothetical protein